MSLAELQQHVLDHEHRLTMLMTNMTVMSSVLADIPNVIKILKAKGLITDDDLRIAREEIRNEAAERVKKEYAQAAQHNKPEESI